MKILTSIWTFLNRERGLGRRAKARVRTPKQRRRQRGVALVAVLVAIAVIFTLTTQFTSNTNVDAIAAANYRDQMRAHFLARSASNLSELVIRIQQRIDNIKELSGQVQITDFADQVLLAFCGNPEEVQAAVGFSTSTTKGLGADVGTCGVVGQITTEDDKINVNCANASKETAEVIKSALDALFYFNGYDPVFEENDAEGWQRDRARQVAAIIDYVDSDSQRLRERGTSEDYNYETLRDPYKAKNNYIDTIGEIKLARGVDDRFWSLFGKAFTVYGGCKVNLSALSNSQLIAGILVLAAKDRNDPVLQDPRKLFALATLVAKAKQFGMQFTKIDDFIEFVKDPSAAVGALAGQQSLAGSQANAAVGAGVPGLTGGEKLKLDLDKTNLARIATAGPRRTYRVQAWGEIERGAKNNDGSPLFPPIRVTINGVWDTKVVPQNARKPPAPKGAWVFLKED
ncbi:MAG: general secretion pathway protein GspK [Deltaproteobacteria bacterium]|nr:general secretion pathway protein GspK [Deltaproteobacteria bacterium]MCW5802418.1 general secretion pathway protein GspK [Deltaproteobacteria bacterium]